MKLTVAYEGGLFRGWQSQSGGNTIQDHLEAAFANISGAPVSVQGAGRTDAGVHALKQCAHADVPAGKLPVERWAAAVNAHLPAQIRVTRCILAPPGFHARFSSRGKIYIYRIWNDTLLPPFEVGRAWLVPAPLDWAIMERSASLLTGTHDFARFAANRGKPGENTVRTIRDIALRKSGRLVTLQIYGEGFLYKMVRLMTGTMVRCAQGRAPLEWISALLASPGTLKTNFAAPAQGLCLARVIYS